MDFIVFLLFSLPVVAVGLLAQFWLIEKNKLFGVVLPLVSFVFALLLFFLTPVSIEKYLTINNSLEKINYVRQNLDFGIQKAILSFIADNIPTVILLLPYFVLKKKKN